MHDDLEASVRSIKIVVDRVDKLLRRVNTLGHAQR